MPNSALPLPQIVSGALHYFRVHPGLWDDRLDKAVAMGLNTIETYIPWNLHEPHRGEFVFDGICDIEKFLHKIAAHQLYAIVRPGPYICAEWDNGGFPGWLNAVPGVKLRRTNTPYLQAVKAYFDVLLPKLVPFQYQNGGPLIMLQLENEYGSYGNDHAYLRYLKKLYEAAQLTVPLVTSDGPYGLYAICGTLPEVWSAGNFGTKTAEAFASLQQLYPDEPECCMEFWDGWYDHWGDKHQHRPVADGGESFAEEYEKLIARGAHSNLYMFHGGTNFGLTAGARGHGAVPYSPIVTSYDYDCPLSECGDPTEKFVACQRILKKYTHNPRIRPVVPSSKIVPAPVKLTASLPLREHLKELATLQGEATTAPTLEELGENFGFIHYETTIPPFAGEAKLNLFEVNDYAQVWIDGRYCGEFMRPNGDTGIVVAGQKRPQQLEILVENLGRINYGLFIGADFKGIAGPVALDRHQLFNWTYHLLPLTQVKSLPFEPGVRLEPAVLYRGVFDVAELGEAFLNFPGRKGCAWINGFSLGRYWSIGPTETLYLPSSALQKTGNELVIFEQEKLFAPEVTFAPEHRLGELA